MDDDVLLRSLELIRKHERRHTALVVAHLAEVDARRLFAAVGFPSMMAYCIERLRYSEDAAAKRIRVARALREYPEIFPGLSDGRLHLSGVSLLKSHLTRANATDLLRAAERRTRSQIEALIAARFPRTEEIPLVVELSLPTNSQPAPGPVRNGPEGPFGSPSSSVESVDSPAVSASTHLPIEPHNLAQPGADTAPPMRDGFNFPVGATPPADFHEFQDSPAPGYHDSPAPALGVTGTAIARPGSNPRASFGARGRVAPIADRRYAIQFSIGQSTHDKLRYARELASHQLPDGDLGEIFDRALTAWIAALERQKYASIAKPSGVGRVPHRARTIPAHVRRAVRERDGGRCTFMSESGKRCGSRRFLEFDHIVPLARGGQSLVSNLRLRCRAHNQLAAELTFGRAFMAEKRDRPRPSGGDAADTPDPRPPGG